MRPCVGATDAAGVERRYEGAWRKGKMHGQGTTPGYTGHVPRVKTHSLGSTTHSMPMPDPSRASKNDGYSGKNDETRYFQTELVKGPDSQFAAGSRGSLA